MLGEQRLQHPTVWYSSDRSFSSDCLLCYAVTNCIPYNTSHIFSKEGCYREGHLFQGGACLSFSSLELQSSWSAPGIDLWRWPEGSQPWGREWRRFRIWPLIPVLKLLLRATRGTCNPNVQVVITHALHACSQRSFGIPLRMNVLHRTQFNHARLDLLLLVIWPRLFWPSVTWNERKAQRWSKIVWIFDRCRPHSLTFGYY